MSKFEKLRTYLNDEAKEKNCLMFKRVSLKLLPLVKRVQPLVRVWTCEPVQPRRQMHSYVFCKGTEWLSPTWPWWILFRAHNKGTWHFCSWFITLWFVFAWERGDPEIASPQGFFSSLILRTLRKSKFGSVANASVLNPANAFATPTLPGSGESTVNKTTSFLTSWGLRLVRTIRG